MNGVCYKKCDYNVLNTCSRTAPCSEMAAPDLVEVVRCKNCRYGIPKGANTVLCCYDNVIGRIKHVFDFCSDGKEKDDQ